MRLRVMAGVLALVVLPAGCGSKSGAASSTPTFPSEDVVSAVTKDKAIAATLPAAVGSTGTLSVATFAGGPPTGFYGDDDRTLTGVDIDMSQAVANVLGVRIKRQVLGFDAILPGIASGKYQVGTGNFGVTAVREKTTDFVTYLSDGQGFAGRKGGRLTSVTSLRQLCGLKVGTTKGTTFAAALAAAKGTCGARPYAISTFSDPASMFLAAGQGRVDVIMSSVNGLRYAVSRQPGLRFLGVLDHKDVGFALPKGSPLAAPIRAAVIKLMRDGVYARILTKWSIQQSGLPTSQISPPEIT